MSLKLLLRPANAAALAAALFAALSSAGAQNKADGTPAFSSQMKCEDGTLTALFHDSKASVQPLGAVMANIFTFGEKQAEGVRQRYGIGDRLQVLAVHQGSPAEQLGVQAGDVIMEINGNYVPRGTDALEQLKSRVIDKVDWNETVSATVIRDGFAIALRADLQTRGTAAIAPSSPPGT